jgi:hypothetical protein
MSKRCLLRIAFVFDVVICHQTYSLFLNYRFFYMVLFPVDKDFELVFVCFVQSENFVIKCLKSFVVDDAFETEEGFVQFCHPTLLQKFLQGLIMHDPLHPYISPEVDDFRQL